MNTRQKEMDCYKALNQVSEHGSVILLGSTFAKSIPVSELAQTFGGCCKIYNRSFQDLPVSEACDIVDEAVLSLHPSKVMIQLGEAELTCGTHSVNDTIRAYEKLIEKIKAFDKKTKIVIVSVCSSEAETAQFNSALQSLAEEHKCQFADIGDVYKNHAPSVKAFNMLRLFFTDRISFADVMSFA